MKKKSTKPNRYGKTPVQIYLEKDLFDSCKKIFEQYKQDGKKMNWHEIIVPAVEQFQHEHNECLVKSIVRKKR